MSDAEKLESRSIVITFLKYHFKFRFCQRLVAVTYKLAALETNGELIPKIKISENVEKITNPGFKELYRLYDKDTGKALGDVLCLAGEKIDESEPYEIFDPNAVWKRTTLTNFEVRDLHVPIFREGKCVYESPSIEEIKQYCKDQIDTLWDETLRLENPQTYYVDLSEKLWDMKHALLKGRPWK